MFNFGRCFILITLTFLQLSSPCYAGKPKEDDVNEEGKRERKKTVEVKERKKHKKSKVVSSSETSTSRRPKSNSQPQVSHDFPQDLISMTKKSPVLYEATLEVWGEKLEELIELSTEGNAEAIGKIGVTCYALSRFNQSTYHTQAPFYEDDEISDLPNFSDLAFKWLSHAKEKGCHSFNIELGYCYLLGLGQVFEDPLAAIKLFKTVPNETKHLDGERGFKRRLLLADSGFDRFIVLNEKRDKDFIAFLEKAEEENNINAKCLLANRKLSTGKANDGLETLTTLASKGNNALAQWLLARANFNGTGVKHNVQLGIKYAFTAATRGCAKAMLFMNESFRSNLTGKVSDHLFSRNLGQMRKWLSTFSKRLYYFDNSLSTLDKTSVVSLFNEELSSLLEDLTSTTPGLWVSCLTAKDSIRKTLGNVQESFFIYQYDDTLTWESPNVSCAKKFDAFLPVCNQKFELVYKIIETEISKTEVQEKVEREEGENAENWNTKQTRLQEAKRLLRKINKMKEMRAHLELLLTALKDLKASTQEERNTTFLSHNPFLNRIE